MRGWLLLAALLIATLAAYQPAWHGGPLWDDDAHLTRSDLRGTEGLRRIWFDLGATQQYYPLIHSTFWLLHALWGDDTLGYHLVNIVLHAVAAFLFAVILSRLAVPWPWLAAFVFALHPVHVESVAWMAELKNTLSGALFLGAALAYLSVDRAQSGSNRREQARSRPDPPANHDLSVGGRESRSALPAAPGSRSSLPCGAFDVGIGKPSGSEDGRRRPGRTSVVPARPGSGGVPGGTEHTCWPWACSFSPC